MAAAPFARDDSAYYTSVGTDLVVTISSTPAHLLANDIDIDGGGLTPSVVTNPTSGSLVSFGTNGTFTYRPNVGFVGIDSFSYKVNDGTSDSNIATVRIAIGTKLLAIQNAGNVAISHPDGGAQTTINTSGLSSFYGVVPFNTTSVNGSSLSEIQTLVLANAGCGTWRVAYV